MTTPSLVERTNTNFTDVELDEKANIHVQIEEVVLSRLTEEDVLRLSEEALEFKSFTGFRICLIMFIYGCNQAGEFCRILLCLISPITY